MTPDPPTPPADRSTDPATYSPPTVTVLGTLAELTRQKEVGAADGTLIDGLDVGS
jgi:hypothetical protein